MSSRADSETRGTATSKSKTPAPKRKKKQQPATPAKRSQLDTRDTQNKATSSLWWADDSDDDTPIPEPELALQYKAHWVTILLGRGPWGVRNLVPWNDMKQKARFAAGYLGFESPGGLYKFVEKDFRSQGVIWQGALAMLQSFGMAPGTYSTSSSQQNNARTIQNYILPRGRVNPLGKPVDSYKEVTEDMVKAGLPLACEAGKNTAQDLYHHRSIVVAVGRILLTYHRIAGEPLTPDPGLSEWYTLKCLCGFTLEQWHKGYVLLHHLVYQRGISDKKSKLDDDANALKKAITVDKAPRGFAIKIPYLVAADLALQGQDQPGKQRKVLKLGTTNFDIDDLRDTDAEDSDQSYKPSSDEEEGADFAATCDRRRGRRKMSRWPAKQRTDFVTAIDKITGNIIDWQQGAQKKAHRHFRNRALDVSFPPAALPPISFLRVPTQLGYTGADSAARPSWVLVALALLPDPARSTRRLYPAPRCADLAGSERAPGSLTPYFLVLTQLGQSAPFVPFIYLTANTLYSSHHWMTRSAALLWKPSVPSPT
jgi:hypothetical protein